MPHPDRSTRAGSEDCRSAAHARCAVLPTESPLALCNLWRKGGSYQGIALAMPQAPRKSDAPLGAGCQMPTVSAACLGSKSGDRSFTTASSHLPRQPGEACIAIHQVANMQNKVGRNPSYASAALNRIKRAPQLPMLGDVCLDVVELLARGSQRLLELRLSLDLGVAQSHLHAAVRVDLSLPRSFDGQEDHFPETVHHGGLHAIGL